MLDEGAVSCVYAYIPGKERRHYTEVFIAVQQRLITLRAMVRVRKITDDFEQAAYYAFKNVFGQQIVVNGCFFHLKQSMFRYAGNLGLRQLIVDGSPTLRPDIRTFVEMIDALAFLPIGHLNLGVMVLYNNIPDPIVRPLLDYFVTFTATSYQMPIRQEGLRPCFPQQCGISSKTPYVANIAQTTFAKVGIMPLTYSSAKRSKVPQIARRYSKKLRFGTP